MTFKTKIEESPKTLRDEFAYITLPVILKQTYDTDSKNKITPQQIAKVAYQLADAMLKEREKTCD